MSGRGDAIMLACLRRFWRDRKHARIDRRKTFDPSGSWFGDAFVTGFF